MSNVVSYNNVQDKIVQLNGQDVILDYAVAELYGVETRVVNQAVRNNPEKFPRGYILELDNHQSAILRSKILTLNESSGTGKHSKYNFKAFTEKGLYMLATILKGERAVKRRLPSSRLTPNCVNSRIPSVRWPRTLTSSNRRRSWRKAARLSTTSSETACTPQTPRRR